MSQSNEDRIYVITVNRPGFLPESDPYAVAGISSARESAAEEVNQATGIDGLEAMSITLAEAKALESEAHKLPDSGGTVGPLPDGYIIDVRPLDSLDLPAEDVAAYTREARGDD